MAEIIVCGDVGRAYFAYWRSPNRQIAPARDAERAVRAIVHVHGGTVSPPPAIPPGLIALFSGPDGEHP
ncbi:hypothetical protein [Actinomadura montaniterrae]|uniref:Uncharacterized protein n=1 Tax=Actinomadura montaniterrae TaxID=1803903 RepID=A0A6L3W2B5_9ACTN|nr:hypothetical protein [Actinomadura montaniterrae]KAB2388675.1 hypothetical protein F9B16_03105 [Actinomadura montaniterrae]